MISSFHLFSHPYPFHLQLLLPGLRHRCSFELSTSANQKKKKKWPKKKIKDNIDNFLVHEWDLEILMIKPLLRLCACAGGGERRRRDWESTSRRHFLSLSILLENLSLEWMGGLSLIASLFLSVRLRVCLYLFLSPSCVCFAFGGVGSLLGVSLSLFVPLSGGGAERADFLLRRVQLTRFFWLFFAINKKMMQSTHSLQLKKKQHSIRFLFFDQLFKYSLEIRNSLKTRSSAFFFGKQ